MTEIKNIGKGIIEINGTQYERKLVYTSAKGITATFKEITADGNGRIISLTKSYLLHKVTAKEAHEILLG